MADNSSSSSLIAGIGGASLILVGMGVGYVCFHDEPVAHPLPDHGQVADSPSVDTPSVDTSPVETPSVSVRSQQSVMVVYSMTPSEANKSLRADIQWAIEMIDQEQWRLLANSFLTFRHVNDLDAILGDDNRYRSSDQTMEQYVDSMKKLRKLLVDAQNGEITLNRNGNVAEITFVEMPAKNIDQSAPEFGLQADTLPKQAVTGLGSDLKKMLLDASDLIAKDPKAFVKSVYPLPLVAKYEDEERLEKHVGRISNETMVGAMAEDLKAAAEAEANITDDIATIMLPPLVDGDPERPLKFQLVNNHWRFFDANRDQRAELVEIAARPIGPFRESGTKVSMIFGNYLGNWKMQGVPIATEIP